MTNYQKQLSRPGAMIMGLLLSCILIFVVPVGFIAHFIFSPLILIFTVMMLTLWILQYIFKRKVNIEDDGGLIAVWALSAPVIFTIVLSTSIFQNVIERFYSFFSGKAPPESEILFLYIWISCLAVLAVLAILSAFYYSYLKTPEKYFVNNELDYKGLIPAILALAFSFFIILVFVMPPSSSLIAAIHLQRFSDYWKGCSFNSNPPEEESYESPFERPNYICPDHGYYDKIKRRWHSDCKTRRAHNFIARIFLLLASIPALIIGVGLIRRGLWSIKAREMISHLPTSKVRGAAVGLIELKGFVEPLPGEDSSDPVIFARNDPITGYHKKIKPFLINDGTGKISVNIPDEERILDDNRFILNKHKKIEGDYSELKLMSGDEIYILGEYKIQNDRDLYPEICPWNPPYGKFLMGLTSKVLLRSGKLGGVFSLDRILGLDLADTLFMIADVKEEQAGKYLYVHWKKAFSWGLFMVSSPILLLLINIL